MKTLVHWCIYTGQRPGKTTLTRMRPGRPMGNACGADPTSHDCLGKDFEANLNCGLNWAKGTSLEMCPKCATLFAELDCR